MTNSNFRFLKEEYPDLARLGAFAEQYIYSDPASSLTKLRILSEQIALNIGVFEGLDYFKELRQVERLNRLEREDLAPSNILSIFHEIRRSGNRSVHSVSGTSAEARHKLSQGFKLAKWFFELYDDDVHVSYIVPKQTASKEELYKQAQEEAKAAKEKAKEVSNKYEKTVEELERTREEHSAYKAKVEKMQAASKQQKEARKERGKQIAKKIQETEAETRARIDQQLRDTGWECDTQTLNYKKYKTLPQKGRNIAIAEWKCGTRWADYALFIGLQLVGIVEAKKHAKNVMSDLQQAKNYSKITKAENGTQLVTHPNSEKYKVPFLFATNGRDYLEQIKIASGIWFWDARSQKNLEKALPNWFSPRDLKEKLAFDEQEGADKLAKTPYDILTDPKGLNLRPYQVEAIKAVEHKILNDPEQRALIAMATGTGKTRTMIGLCYRLIQSGRFRRILFLVDRNMLGEQAQDAFREVKIEGLQTFAEIYDLRQLKQAATELDTKIHFATVQSMVHRINYSDQLPPSTGDYDCIVVDEAHRGYTLDREMDAEELILHDQLDYQSKYRMVLDHFDAYRIGLTATPAIHTEAIFGERVFTYSFSRAVIEGYLIDMEPPIVFQTELGKNGIVWKEGEKVKVYDPETNEILDAGTTEDEIKVEIKSFNRRVINDSFNRTLLRELILNEKYALDPEDRKKTLIFAATDAHADMIVHILKNEFDKEGIAVDQEAIVKITGVVDGRKDLLKKYKNEQYPSIVVTVDLLTTGIDVPSICNLVFLRQVKSRILYDQMIGRATRKCEEVGKEVFKVYDCVGVSEIMAKEQVMKPIAPAVNKSFVHLSKEIDLIEEEQTLHNKIDRVIAKLQRKLRGFDEQQIESFQLLANAENLTDFALKLKEGNPEQIKERINEYSALWEYLDRQTPQKEGYKLYSEHKDKLLDTKRAYHNNLKPKDYLESFDTYIKNNINKVEALKIICTKPASLTRKDLKQIKLSLDEEGFNQLHLNKAYKEVTNEEIVADIIAHIRRAALGNPLVPHEERIRKAVDKLKKTHRWSAPQIKWIDRIEDQLLVESVISLDDLDRPPFKNFGGIRQMNKAFKNGTETMLNQLNQYLYGS